ncbi:hypothetical protein K438DRAFT_2056702 [Mycena galopus ATCC 62051]|nr:hypothetical protein K438DRAFT_2056702 [Mycena galopus ATCC 62051]
MLQWHHETQTPLPVNLVFCFEGMEENGSEGLDELVEREANEWFKGVDCVSITRPPFRRLRPYRPRAHDRPHGPPRLARWEDHRSGRGRHGRRRRYGGTRHIPKARLVHRGRRGRRRRQDCAQR